MQDEIKVWLEDIEKAISEINEFLPNPRNYFEFEKDLKTKRAVERNIEIIGEAMSRILKVKPAGVDVHTGVENSSGRKDKKLIQQFVNETKKAFNKINNMTF